MKFDQAEKCFIKSNNSTKKIFIRYPISLTFFLIYIFIYNIVTKNYQYIINITTKLLIGTALALIIGFIIDYIKKNDIKENIKDSILWSTSIIISIFSVNTNLLIFQLAILVSISIYKICNNIKFSAILYGIFVILLYQLYQNEFNNIFLIESRYILLNKENLIKLLTAKKQLFISPIVTIIAFIYLFNKKSIKYNLVFSYLIASIVSLSTIGIVNKTGIIFILKQVIENHIVFLCIYCLSDYIKTPSTREGQLIYGFISSILSIIMMFILPKIGVIITMIILPILLNKRLENISYKLNNNPKFYSILITSLIIINILAIILISHIII